MEKNNDKTIEEEEIESDRRFRLFTMVLYKESIHYNYEDTIRLLKSMGQYAMIVHQPESDEKQEHVHFVLRLKNQKKLDKLSEETGVPISKIKNVRSERMILRYLIHLDDKDKIQYDYHQVECSPNYQRTFRKAIDDLESEEQIICNIYNFISDITNKESTRSNVLYYLIQYVNSNCYDTIYKRYRQEFYSYLTDLL